METGQVVEFIDRQKIICAVVLEIKSQRLRLLTETNREINLGASRLSYRGDTRINAALGRDKMVEALKQIARRREELIGEVDIAQLWEVLCTEQQWIDLATMTAFCFPHNPTDDHESAVVRAFFRDRLYFKFDHDRFFPYTTEQVEQVIARREEEQRRAGIVETCGSWLERIDQQRDLPPSAQELAENSQCLELLKSFFLFEKDSRDPALAKAVLTRGGIGVSGLFPLLVRLGVFDKDENLDLLRLGHPIAFEDQALATAHVMIQTPAHEPSDPRRKDLTGLPLMTIDGQATLDFDDALSMEDMGDCYRLGIHIADVASFIPKGDPLDRAASLRGSSIYMPDRKIPMLPAELAEGRFSLKAGEIRPAISTLVRISHGGEILGYEIVASTIRVRHQMTYHEINMISEDNRAIVLLRDIASSFRRTRLEAGAVQITLPEIHIWLDETGAIAVNRINRESPGRMLVAELMIMANWLMARFLKANQMPGVFRSQPAPVKRLFEGEEGTVFQNIMQRRLLSRFVLSARPETHNGLGLDAYITATSPIRKYFDLVTQRQVRAVLGLEPPYNEQQIDRIIAALAEPMGRVSAIQRNRQRYWLLKYLETRIGQKEEAMVLGKRRSGYQILLTETMLEWDLTTPISVELQPEQIIAVTVSHADARNEQLGLALA